MLFGWVGHADPVFARSTWDALIAPIWLGVNGLLGYATWTTARQLYPYDRPLHVLLHTVASCWGCITLVAACLGAAGLLTGWGMLVGVALVAGLLLVTARGRVLRPIASLVRHSPPSRTAFPWGLLWWFVAALGVSRVVVDGLPSFPSDWDTLTYHLPLVDQWLRARSLYAPDCSAWSVPGNNELLTLWVVAAFSGDFLVSLTNLPATVLLGAGAVALTRELGLSRPFSHLASLAILSNFVVFNQLTDAGNDLAVAALFITCLWYGLRYVHRGSRPDVFFFSVCLGLLAGVKFYALGYAFTAFVAVAVLTVGCRGWGSALWVLLVAVLGACVFGGYWYARNTLITGSPLYPKRWSGDGDMLTQMYPWVALTSFWGNGRPELLPLAVRAVWRMAGLCHLLAVLGLPVTLLWLVVTGLRYHMQTDRKTEGTSRLVLAVMLVMTCTLLLITPFAVEDEPHTLNHLKWAYTPVRYGLCFLSLAVIALALVCCDLTHDLLGAGAEFDSGPGVTHTVGVDPPGLQLRSMPARVLCSAPQILFAGAVVSQMVFIGNGAWMKHFDSLLVAINVFLLGMAVWLCWLTWPGLRQTLTRTLLIMTLACVWVSCVLLSRHWHTGFDTHFSSRFLTGSLSKLSEEDPSLQYVCVLDPRPYPFFGSARQFRVCQPLWVPSFPWLKDYLRKRPVTLVAVPAGANPYLGSAWKQFGSAEVWFVECPGLFVRVEQGDWLQLYRVNRGLLDTDVSSSCLSKCNDIRQIPAGDPARRDGLCWKWLPPLLLSSDR